MFFEMLAGKWAVNDPFPLSADFIAMLSGGATETRLTRASAEMLSLTDWVLSKYPDIPVVWGTFSKNPAPEIEKLEKEKILPKNRSIYVWSVSSSTDECEIIRAVITKKISCPQNIIVITEGSHSRRARVVWKYYFPQAHICFRSISPPKGEDRENPMWLWRSWRVWLVANIIAFPFYNWWPGVKWFAEKNFSQPAS